MKKIIEYLLPFIVAILILTMGFYLGEIKREAIIYAILVSIVAMVIATIMMRRLSVREMEKLGTLVDELETKTKEIREPGFTIKIPGILDAQELVRISESLIKEEYCVISPALRYDLTHFKELDIKLFKKGITARYIISNKAQNEAKKLLRLWKENGVDVENQVKFRIIDEYFIQSEVAIFDLGRFESFVVVSVPSGYAYKDHPILGGAIYIDDKYPDLVGFYTNLFEGLWKKAEPLIMDESTNEEDH